MTYTLFDTLSGANQKRSLNNFSDDMLYISSLSDDLYQYVIGGADSNICDISTEGFNSAEAPVLLNGTSLFMFGRTASPVRRRVMSYDGTPGNWTFQANLETTADTVNQNNKPQPSSGRNYIVAVLGRTDADGTDYQAGASQNGSTWAFNSFGAGYTSGGYPITVAGGATYFACYIDATGNLQWGSFDNGSWAISSTVWDTNDFYPLGGINFWCDQEQSGSGFSGIWMVRDVDQVLMRSTDGGDNFSATQTGGAVNFTIAAGKDDIYSCGGFEFAISAVSGANRLWYFNGLVWQMVDSTALPTTADLGGIFKRGTTIYISFVTTGIYTTDEFTFPVAPSGNDWTAAPMRKPVDIDADGTNIYIATLDSAGFPALIQFATALNADGSIVFQPGAGADIGVECSETNADVIWVAGEFGGTNTVERSDDGAASFGVVDPATFSPVTAFDVGPDSDERCLVATLTAGTVDTVEIHETINAGDSWVERNSGLTSPIQILALDRLDANPDEVVFGSEDNTTDRSDYSPNAGANLDDITTGTPTDDTTGVIVG